MVKTFGRKIGYIFISFLSILFSGFILCNFFAERNLKQVKNSCKYFHDPDSTSIPWKFIDLTEKPHNRLVEFWGENFKLFCAYRR